ncbi:MAG: NUDIX hydrolase [Myxococcota bacterium]
MVLKCIDARQERFGVLDEASLSAGGGVTPVAVGPIEPEAVRDRLRRHARRALPLDGRRPAAVAVTLLVREGRLAFLLTRRASHLPRHAGQWALPGGRTDADENAPDAARRELQEEVGVALPSGAVMGLLDDYPTRSGFRITPVVVWAGQDPPLVPDPNEVASVHHVPVGELDRPEVPRLTPIPQSNQPVLSIPLPSVDTEVFAPTAAILYQLREVLFHGRHTPVAHYEQPLFAWR